MSVSYCHVQNPASKETTRDSAERRESREHVSKSARCGQDTEAIWGATYTGHTSQGPRPPHLPRRKSTAGVSQLTADEASGPKTGESGTQSFPVLSPENKASSLYTANTAKEHYSRCRLNTLQGGRNLTIKKPQTGKCISSTVGEKQQITAERGKQETGLFREGEAGVIRLGAGITF